LCVSPSTAYQTHDLEKILKACINLDSSFQQLDLFATSLNGLDVRFRYPDVEFEPEESEVVDAIGRNRY
jgi:HEPN domain-containing protein